MAVVSELIKEENGALCFGNYELSSKTKLDGFDFKGDKYKVKTFKEIIRRTKSQSSRTMSMREICIRSKHSMRSPSWNGMVLLYMSQCQERLYTDLKQQMM